MIKTKCTDCGKPFSGLPSDKTGKCGACQLIIMAGADQVSATIAERGKVYGDPLESHTNIGMAWTGLIQQHYGITLAHPLPASLVAQMLVAFKNQRSAKVYKDDNYLDMAAYAKFAEQFQKEGK